MNLGYKWDVPDTISIGASALGLDALDLYIYDQDLSTDLALASLSSPPSVTYFHLDAAGTVIAVAPVTPDWFFLSPWIRVEVPAPSLDLLAAGHVIIIAFGSFEITFPVIGAREIIPLAKLTTFLGAGDADITGLEDSIDEVVDSVSGMDETMRRVLGLVHENILVHNVHDMDGKHVSSMVATYPRAIDVEGGERDDLSTYTLGDPDDQIDPRGWVWDTPTRGLPRNGEFVEPGPVAFDEGRALMLGIVDGVFPALLVLGTPAGLEIPVADLLGLRFGFDISREQPLPPPAFPRLTIVYEPVGSTVTMLTVVIDETGIHGSGVTLHAWDNPLGGKHRVEIEVVTPSTFRVLLDGVASNIVNTDIAFEGAGREDLGRFLFYSDPGALTYLANFSLRQAPLGEYDLVIEYNENGGIASHKMARRE